MLHIWSLKFATQDFMAMCLGARGPGCSPGLCSGGSEKLDRTVLPIPEPTYPPITALDARDVKPPPRFQVKAPSGAPNVVIVLIDDMGFGQSSVFGGGVQMPTEFFCWVILLH